MKILGTNPLGTKPLQYPAPARMSIKGNNGKFVSKPWDEAGVVEALSAGAWFAKSRHDFADSAASTLANPK